MITEKKYKGIVVPAVTPLTADFKLDKSAVEKIFDHFRKQGVAPFILGTTGEAPSLSLNLKTEYLKLAGKLKQNGDVLYAGISSNSIEESIDLAKAAFDAGVDVVAATLPSYYMLSESEMKTYFEQLAKSINGPLIIYNIPATTHMSVPLQLIDELSYHENIVGTKDSERSEERLTTSLQLWSHRNDFSHFLGWAAKSAEALLNGSDGLIPSTGNLHPALYNELYTAALNDDKEKAFQLQRQSDVLGNVYQAGRTLGSSLWALKVLMKEYGLCQPHVMPPLQPGSNIDEQKLKKELEEILAKEEITIAQNYSHA